MTSANFKRMQESAGERLALLLECYHRLTGEILAADADALWNATCAVLAHDRSVPPEFFYANARTLSLFKRSADTMIGLPSHLSAEPDAREERAAMFAKLEAKDIVTGYSGIRVAADGSRFRIVDAAIWNLRDASGTLHGQAARIEAVEMLSR
ncbi:MEKHLA domain-containing protein [Aurantiacibacter odishensis]|uniref:MEKHLA domain-containing protein n=1 Tax=Aurantiacibacter odishensis TaxID=1155476 RepID=UPI0013C43063|nr:MEKHLA domain-containing protein [Aurantiacibacter odishensis]